jgi:hypothetical protein
LFAVSENVPPVLTSKTYPSKVPFDAATARYRPISPFPPGYRTP